MPADGGADMLVWIAIAAGGALGALARHGVNRVTRHQFPLLRFPAETVIVNVIGCFLIGVLAGLIVTGRIHMRPIWREFAFVGLLGGFTTFSTFGFETIALLRTGYAWHAVANVVVQFVCGLGAVSAGLAICERLGAR
jgi:fluoride exporter